ncbi:MAG: hypothetical protein KGQ37_09470, partial [Hyphomicrobiales bacterium]|nr:hypothetical protein [Hyphomicrobiales bacterium]
GGAADGGAAAAGAAPGAAARLDQTTPAAAAAAAAATTQAWKMPDGFPDHLRGNTAEEFATKIAADWQKQRAQVSKFDPARSADEYTFTPSEAIKGIVGDVSKDPVFNAARESAFKAGVPKAAFNDFVGGVYEALQKQNLLPAPYDPVKERAAFLGEEGRGLNDAQIVEKVTPILEGALAFVTELGNNGTIDQAGREQLLSLMDTAAGARAILSLQKLVARQGLSPGGQGGAQQPTGNDLKGRLADPRNDRDNLKYDRAFAEETARLYQKKFS